jgi:endonuclease/exonuclease/phosphatase family metal-dependent hydrolase
MPRLVIRTGLTRFVIAAAVAVASFAAATVPAEAHRGTTITVMTRNVYLGGDLTPSIAAPTLSAFLAANAALLTHVDLMNFRARAELIADEIIQHRPDLVGLQEVALWRTGPLGDPGPATTVRHDYLSVLMSKLRHWYGVAVVQTEADLEAPAGAPHNVDVRLTMHDVILVRRGGRVRITGTSSANFVNNLVLPLPAVGASVTSRRGWTAVDAVRGHRSFRFVNTHLEAFHAGIRVLQAQELLAGPVAGGPGDVILAGDLNTGPDLPDPNNRLAYFTLVAGGLVDTWPILHPGDAGPTAGLGSDLDQPADSLENRIDMVMFRGAFVPRSSHLFGNERQTAQGRWPSDHLGHVATLSIR